MEQLALCKAENNSLRAAVQRLARGVLEQQGVLTQAHLKVPPAVQVVVAEARAVVSKGDIKLYNLGLGGGSSSVHDGDHSGSPDATSDDASSCMDAMVSMEQYQQLQQKFNQLKISFDRLVADAVARSSALKRTVSTGWHQKCSDWVATHVQDYEGMERDELVLAARALKAEYDDHVATLQTTNKVCVDVLMEQAAEQKRKYEEEIIRLQVRCWPSMCCSLCALHSF